MPIALTAQYAQSGNFNTTGTPKTVSTTVANGDRLVIITCCADYRQLPQTPTGGGLTYTNQLSVNFNISNLLNNVGVWTAPAVSGQTFTLSVGISPNNSFVWGFVVLRFSGVSQVGAKGSAQDSTDTTAPSLNLTTGVNDSCVVMVVSDFGTNAAARTYRTADAGTFTESYTTSNTNFGSIDIGYYLNAGAAGVKTIGQTAPSPRQWICGAVELQPTIITPAVKQIEVQSRAALVDSYHR